MHAGRALLSYHIVTRSSTPDHALHPSPGELLNFEPSTHFQQTVYTITFERGLSLLGCQLLRCLHVFVFFPEQFVRPQTSCHSIVYVTSVWE